MLDAAMSPWNLGLFELRQSDHLTIADALRDPSKFVELLEREDRNGKHLFRVDFRPQGQMHISAWIDPSVNYLVRRMVLDNPETESRFEREVREFREGPPGVFFPVRIHHRSIHKGALMSEANLVVSELRINEAIDPAKLRLTFPKGTYVNDRTKGVEYIAAADESPDPPTGVRPISPQTPGRVQYATGQGPETPSSWQHTLAWTALAVAGASAMVWLFARWRIRAIGE